MYIVHQKNKGTGVVYVYESAASWDKEKQQARSRRKCIGRLDPITGELIPSNKYLAEKELETLRKQLPGPVPTTKSNRLFYGATYLFDAIGEQLGIIGDLRHCFPSLYEKILFTLREANDRSKFNAMLDQLETELLNETPKHGVQLTPKQRAIDEAQKNYGYFALISNEIKDPLEALRIYRARDIIEKAFGNLKDRLNMRRTAVSSDESLDGKLFVYPPRIAG